MFFFLLYEDRRTRNVTEGRAVGGWEECSRTSCSVRNRGTGNRGQNESPTFQLKRSRLVHVRSSVNVLDTRCCYYYR